MRFADEDRVRKIRTSFENKVAVGPDIEAGDTVIVTLAGGGLGIPRVLSIDAWAE